MIIVGHRGAAGYAPENTLAGFKKALEIGVDMVELDVHLSKDGVVVVHHDSTLERTTSGSGKIKHHDWENISLLDAGSSFAQHFKNENVPSLEDVMILCKGKIEILIEVKDVYPDVENKIIKLIRKHNAEKWCVVQSFKDEVIFGIHKISPHIRLHKLLVYKPRFLPLSYDVKINTFSFKKYHFVESFNLLYKNVDKRFIDNAHKQKKKVMVWTVNNPKDIKRMKGFGVDGIISDYPDRCF